MQVNLTHYTLRHIKIQVILSADFLESLHALLQLHGSERAQAALEFLLTTEIKSATSTYKKTNHLLKSSQVDLFTVSAHPQGHEVSVFKL